MSNAPHVIDPMRLGVVDDEDDDEPDEVETNAELCERWQGAEFSDGERALLLEWVSERGLSTVLAVLGDGLSENAAGLEEDARKMFGPERDETFALVQLWKDQSAHMLDAAGEWERDEVIALKVKP